MRECYSETVRVGWMNLDTVTIMKEHDPVSWNLALSEWIDVEEQDGNLVSFDLGLNYYDLWGVEGFISEHLEESSDAS